MNLRETIQALEQNSIEVAIDLGAHAFCTIDSNCPLAIELRRVIGAADVTVEQLTAGFVASQESPPEPISYELPEVNGNVSLMIAGYRVNLDLTHEVQAQLDMVFADRVADYAASEDRLRRLGRTLYDTYLQAIAEVKKTKTLPQLAIGMADIIKYKCLITTDNTNYLLLFPIEYKPQWIYKRGVRYQIAQEDIEAIQDDIFVVFPVSKENKILGPYLIEKVTGAKLQHYHGRGGDCWGDVGIPNRWDGSLQGLSTIAYQLQAALATVNMDSLMQHEPEGMPLIEAVLERCRELGGEGFAHAPGEDATTPQQEQETLTLAPDVPVPPLDEQPQTRRRWGNGRG